MNPFRPSLFYSQAQKYLNISGKVFYQNKAKHHLSRISWGMRTYWSSRKRFVLIQVLKSPHHHCLIFMKYINAIIYDFSAGACLSSRNLLMEMWNLRECSFSSLLHRLRSGLVTPCLRFPVPAGRQPAVSVLVTRPGGHMGQSTEGAGCQGPLHLYNYYTLTIYCLARVCAL